MGFVNNTSKQLKLLIIIFIFGFISLITVNQLFLKLVDNLDKENLNLKSKIELGKLIATDLYILKSEFFELTAATNSFRSRDLVNKSISQAMNNILDTLNVLENGGTLIREVKLNIVGHTKTTINVTYQTKGNQRVSLEVIDLEPKLVELTTMIDKLNTMLSLKDKFIKSKDAISILNLSKKVGRYNKSTPAFFDRMIENIQRLLYEGGIELKELDAKIENKKFTYTIIKLVLISSVILIVVLFGMRITKQISKESDELVVLNKELAQKESSVKAILDGQKNMVIVSDGFEMLDANHSIVNFFDEFETLDEFKNNYDCICDFFETHIPDDTYIVKKDYDGKTWLEYILENPEIDFKVILNNGREDHHFAIVANKKFLNDNENFIVIVSLNDISAVIKSQHELAHLNLNLEHIISDKTEELRILNNNLEVKIQEELEKNRDKDKQMMQQSRSAALGEMIGNIAHQWRQPLSAISSTVSGQQVQLELGITTNDEINKALEDIKGYVSFLNQTIDDFRGFLKEDKEKVDFIISDIVEKSVSVANAAFKDNKIEIIFDLNKSNISNGLPSELSQVFLNILNNAKDATIENNIQNKFVHVRSSEDELNNIIFIQDNAGGIPENIITKIFDPYFTTKHQSQGTGIGLYMSKDIIEKHMNGLLTVKNKTLILDGIEYNGASFKISIPKKLS